MQSISIATWNVNGIRARLERVTEWLLRNPVDLLCVQELKAQNEQFPENAFRSIGYEASVYGQKSFNGVALIHKLDVSGITCGGPKGFHDARLIGGNIENIRVYSAYFPNGQDVGTDKYEHKLKWMAALRDMLEDEIQVHPNLVLAGDINVAPEPKDTYDPSKWEGGIICSDKERHALANIREVGLHDTFRTLHPDETEFTWWDYRAGSFYKNHGLRIDHVYVSTPLLPTVSSIRVDRSARSAPQPSDHAPVVIVLKLNR